MISALIIYTQFFSRIVIPKAVDLSYVRKGVPILTLFGLLLGLIIFCFDLFGTSRYYCLDFDLVL